MSNKKSIVKLSFLIIVVAVALAAFLISLSFADEVANPTEEEAAVPEAVIAEDTEAAEEAAVIAEEAAPAAEAAAEEATPNASDTSFIITKSNGQKAIKGDDYEFYETGTLKIVLITENNLTISNASPDVPVVNELIEVLDLSEVTYLTLKDINTKISNVAAPTIYVANPPTTTNAGNNNFTLNIEGNCTVAGNSTDFYSCLNFQYFDETTFNIVGAENSSLYVEADEGSECGIGVQKLRVPANNDECACTLAIGGDLSLVVDTRSDYNAMDLGETNLIIDTSDSVSLYAQGYAALGLYNDNGVSGRLTIANGLLYCSGYYEDLSDYNIVGPIEFENNYYFDGVPDGYAFLGSDELNASIESLTREVEFGPEPGYERNYTTVLYKDESNAAKAPKTVAFIPPYVPPEPTPDVPGGQEVSAAAQTGDSALPIAVIAIVAVAAAGAAFGVRKLRKN